MDKLQEEFNKGFQLHGEGKLDEAEEIYRELINQNYRVAEMWNLIGMIYMQRFQLSKAEEYMLKAIEISPNAYFFENLAKVYLEKEDSEKAIELYCELLKINPDNFNYLFTKIICNDLHNLLASKLFAFINIIFLF